MSYVNLDIRDVNELKNLLGLVQKENNQLKVELELLKESTIVSSMNDMRDAYGAVVKKNQQLEKRIMQYELDPLKDQVASLQRKLTIYKKMFQILKKRSTKAMTVCELIEKALRYSTDEDGEIEMCTTRLEGMFAVQHAANEELECFFEYDLHYYKKCLQGSCDKCYRCDIDDMELSD